MDAFNDAVWFWYSRICEPTHCGLAQCVNQITNNQFLFGKPQNNIFFKKLVKDKMET